MTWRGGARRRGGGLSALSLDSLVDVVTNTNGMLILLAVFTTFIAMGKTYRVSYPMVRATEKTPVFFECRGGRTLLVLRGAAFGEDYQAAFIGYGIAAILKEGDRGENSREIGRPESKFQQVIASLDPETEYAFFVVRPDGFEAFRAAREAIWNARAGLQVGWEPFEQEGTVVFGRGRTPTPQS